MAGRREMGSYGSLLLLRHGESTANADGLFTGLLDVGLTPRGFDQAEAAARMINAAHLRPDHLYTSTLRRTQQTADIVLTDLDERPMLIDADWRLNERNYGALTGRSKRDVVNEHGEAQFLAWRRSFAVRPPAMDDDLLHTLARSPALAGLPPTALTRTESLADVITRVGDFVADELADDLLCGQLVMIIAHGNSLRALCAILDGLGAAAVEELNIPTGQPLLYRFDGSLRPAHPGGEYLDPDTAHEAAILLKHEGGT